MATRMLTGPFAESEVRVELNDDATFSFPLNDGYWARLFERKDKYEEEIDLFLQHVASDNYRFVDCGANFGFWSVLASSRTYGAKQALAVEAASENFIRLKRNAALNGDRFSTLHAAIAGSTGEAVRVYGSKHEALSIVPDGSSARGDAVTTISLDTLLSNSIGSSDCKPLLVKLDVEGAEIEALRGATNVMEAESLLICEEHGSDRDHLVTRHILRETPCQVFYYEQKAEKFERIFSFHQLEQIKRRHWVGYNVFATGSEFWLDRLSSFRPPVGA